MGLIVQKFGGTSVGSIPRIRQVAERVLLTVRQGYSVVVVVSAMGHETDRLMGLALELSPDPCQRELDMLLSTGEQVSIALVAMALQQVGLTAVSLTGAQVGIVTECQHTQARILKIRTQRVRQHLDRGEVVVVAGFQGVMMGEHLEVTTLGRGGSDTTAVALAAALDAVCCEIYTDVAGVYTTDPRLVPAATLVPEITSEEMLELASVGAQVLHPRAVEIAQNYGVGVIVRSNWHDFPGTKVRCGPRRHRDFENMEVARPVERVEVDPTQAKIALLRVPDRPGVAQQLFAALADSGVDVDLVIQSVHSDQRNDIAFTVRREYWETAQRVAQVVGAQLGCAVTLDRQIAKVSVVGVGVRSRAGIAAQMFATLARLGVNIQMISTSEIKLSCVIDLAQAALVKVALETTFDLPPSTEITSPPALTLKAVRGVALDRDQARLAVQGIPDRPGMAAKLLEQLAQGGITVDMIIQSQRGEGQPLQDIALTVPRSQLTLAQQVIERAARGLGCEQVTASADVVKVSAVGAGMVGTPGIAARMFGALAEQAINIQMISTSDIKVSCVVAEAAAHQALEAVHTAFGLQSQEAACLEAPP
ncbi:aspartate kinase [Candidatus Cyanaurora vandensis]|uniref:aspartate kinase n=1 Tax=Candidatus Cyanaurora vandensis TaxID=2714958 RepID=UPI002580CBC0|nr:aspartate kinase [Candidatus Cyanaurora vandensis]